MNEAPIQTFVEAICDTHGADLAIYTGRATVRETFEGEVVWEGEVLSFSLRHPTATTCYCWEVDGTITSVLHEGLVDSPEKAVRAAIVADGGPEPAEAG